MKVFKFGGASVKSVDAIINMANIVEQYCHEPLIVVVSAMDKTTNALEEILSLKLNQDDYADKVSSLKSFHISIGEGLSDGVSLPLDGINEIFNAINQILDTHDPPSYDEYYDQLVGMGEDLSTLIISEYLKKRGMEVTHLDARTCIKTDSLFRDAVIDWKLTHDKIKGTINEIPDTTLVITQGFIGSDPYDRPTTLGREGSDFTAAIFASCLDAGSVTIWKDVPGIMNGDPKVIKDVILFDELPYNEASEMTFYGASVIHPKTIKPLANKKIPLHVRPFNNPEAKGTLIHDCKVSKLPPTIIFKHNQCLFSCKVIDFTFVNEENISHIFKQLHDLNIKINIMQNSAISFSICFDAHPVKIKSLHDNLAQEFGCYYNEDLTLVTIKNYDEETIRRYTDGKNILLQQKSRKNYRCLVAKSEVAEF